MDEKQAKALAKILDGETWQSGGDIWLVLKRRIDGHLVVISDESICEYDSDEDFENNSVKQSIFLA